MNYRIGARTPNHGRPITPEIMVWHTTEGGTKAYLNGLFAGYYNRGDGVNVSVHWAIYEDGEVVEYAPWRPGEAVACWHAGQSEWRGRPSCNYWSLGCEIQHLSGRPYPEAQIRAICELARLITSVYPQIEHVTHAQIAWPRGRKSDPTPPWATDVWPRLVAALAEEDNDMTQEQYDKLERSARAASFVGAITNALLVGDQATAAKLNEEFYQQFPSGRSGLPKGWAPSPK